MRRSPRRPLILKRRKLPFQQKEPTPADPSRQSGGSKEPSNSSDSSCFPDGVRFIGHPSLSDTQVVVIPKATDVQSVISVLAAKGKDSGVQGPSKFILLSDNGNQDQAGSFCETATSGGDAVSTQIPSQEPATKESTHTSLDVTGIKPLSKDGNSGPLDDSLTNIQWLGKMNTCALESEPAKQIQGKENQAPVSQTAQAASVPPETKPCQQPLSGRPPYSYMAMIQFAINSRKNRRMTLKEIYTWIEDHFPYYRQVAKPGWKNSIRHNLSLHDMFVRETAPDGKVSFWTIRPEANRCLTLDQPGCDPVTAPVPVPMLLFPNQSQKKTVPDGRKIALASERRMKPLLPRTESYLVPIQLPVAPPVYLPSFTCPQQRVGTSQAAKRVRISPKVTQSDAAPPPPPPPLAVSPPVTDVKVEMKEEPVCVPLKCETPKGPQKRRCSSSRRKQCLVNSSHEEPVLLCPDSSFLDSGVTSDASMFQDSRDVEPEEPRRKQDSPDRDYSFKTPIKGSIHLTSSTPSKPSPTVVLEPWKVTPVGKGNLLDVSPIRTPGGPALTPVQDYTTYSFSSTPFKDVPLFSSPRELLHCGASRAEAAESPIGRLRSSCSRELLQGGGGGGGGGTATPANRSLTEGLMLDLLNDSLSKILVDINFSGLEDEELGTANISLSDFINQLK
ncbi:forkhead box protein M1 isoform X2 [Oryzias latipes]|uniref:forkhead box protein M1 isoform X2 n=1 Tax=Oryzias latipes TaxID=8090 RepID=UPI0005CB973C|nr:forkhead box protein M1 isoform X2 [Oryzias latipes]